MPRTVKRRVRSQSYGSLGDLKKSLKRSGGGASAKIGYIPEDPITVRFLSEPETWVGYHEHYNGPDADPRYSPCTEGECCQNLYQNNKPAFRYLANAYVVDSSKVQALKMPKSLVEQVVAFYSKYGTVLDRDYELSRSGSGMNTTYTAVPEDKHPMKIARFRKEMNDLQQLLEDWANEQEASDDDQDEEETWNDEDDDDDDAPPPVKKRGTRARLKDHPGGMDEFRPKRRPVSTKGVEEDDDEPPRRRPAKKAVAKTAAKRAVVRKPVAPKSAKRTVRRTTR